MERDKMIYTGLRCKVNTKAAFVDMCMRTPVLEAKMLMSAVINAECGKQIYGMNEEKRTGVFAMQVKLDEEKREQIYEEIFGAKLCGERLEQLPAACREMLKPIKRMHCKEMNIDVIPFIVYGIVRNSRCRDMLETLTAVCVKECLTEFRQSEYNTAGYLQRYLLDERKAAKLAAGLLLLLRKEEDDGKYRMVMDIIYAGCRPLKNMIKKLNCLTGEYYREVMEKDVVMELVLARMVMQMVIAEDLGIPVVHDYEFCQVVCMLKSYEDDRKNGEVQEIDMAEGKRIYRKLLRRHWNPGAYYISAFLEEEGTGAYKHRDKLENLLFQFGLEVRALYGLCLEKWEAEALCAIFEEEDWDKYRYLLLIATLCKYIQQIEAMYEQEIPEEIQYREACREDRVKSLEYEIKRLEEKIRILELKKKNGEEELTRAECQIRRLKREGEKKDQQYAKERAELLEIREAAERFEKEENRERKQQKAADGGRDRDKDRDREPLDVERLDRSIVIGGHRNWQKKMRQCLPGSQFVASDHMHFDPAVLHNKKYIIVNTDILKHGMYYKIMSEKKKEQKILYVHGNNVERVLQEIADQL